MTPQWNEQLAGPNVPGIQRFFGWIGDPQLTREGLRRARNWLTVAGLIALINGIVAILVPAVASLAFSIFIGWVLIAAAIAIGVSAFARRSPLRMLEAVLTFIAAFYILAFPLSGTVTLTFVLAAWFFASGVLTLTHAAQQRPAPEAGITALGGLLSIVLGCLIAASLPSSASWAIGLIVGINLIFWGVRALIGARLLKDLEN